MTKKQYDDKLNDFIKSMKNYKKTDVKKAFEIYVGYMKETGGTKQIVRYLLDNKKAPHEPLFGYKNAKSAFNSGRYVFDRFCTMCSSDDIMEFTDDWRAEPTLFKDEPEPALIAEDVIEYMNEVLDVLNVIAERLGALLHATKGAAV